MRKSENMMLRGATWYLRVAVPRSLQLIRGHQGQPVRKDVWRSLETGNFKDAKDKAIQLKAAMLREFAEEEQAYHQRPTPPLGQLVDSADAFSHLVRTSLANERLETLPGALAVREAEAEQARLALSINKMGPGAAGLEEALYRYFDLDWVITASDQMDEARAVLLAELTQALRDLDFSKVDPFIRELGKARGLRLEADDAAYRQLGHLLLKRWIGELERADANFLDPAIGLVDQDATLENWSRPSVTGAADAAHMISASSERGIEQLFEQYLAERFPDAPESALLERRRNIRQFIDVAGVKPITSYRKSDMVAFKEALLKLPTNAGRDFAGLTVQQVLAKAPPAAPRLAAKTVLLRLSIMGNFGKWLSENVDGVNPANFKVSPPSLGKKERKVKPFTDVEVRTIFGSYSYTGCESERNQSLPGRHKVRGYRLWLPLVAAFTGCRLNELAQLRTDDVGESGGIPVLFITDAGEGQSLKTRSSERIVPVHPQLLEAGFLHYVAKVKSQGHEFVFHDVPLDAQGRRSTVAGKRFRRTLERLGIKGAGDRGGYHRFRHTVVQKLRDAGNLDHEIALVVGHETGMAQMTAGYGSTKQMLASQRLVILGSLQYPGLDLSAIRED